MEDFYDEDFNIDLTEEETFEDIPSVDEEFEESSAPVPEPIQEEDSEKIEKALKKILEDIGDEKEESSEDGVSEESSDSLSEEQSEEKTEDKEVETSSAKDYEPYLTDILQEIKDSDSSKEVSQMYQAVTSVTDNNVLTGQLNEQSATNVILLAIFTVLLVDTAIHFIKGVL